MCTTDSQQEKVYTIGFVKKWKGIPSSSDAVLRQSLYNLNTATVFAIDGACVGGRTAKKKNNRIRKADAPMSTTNKMATTEMEKETNTKCLMSAWHLEGDNEVLGLTISTKHIFTKRIKGE